MLELPDVDAAMRERFLRVIRDEVARDERARLQALAGDAAASLKTRWPLEDMLGADLVRPALRRIEAARRGAGRAPPRSTRRCG